MSNKTYDIQYVGDTPVGVVAEKVRAVASAMTTETHRGTDGRMHTGFCDIIVVDKNYHGDKPSELLL